ncbi:MAG: sulfite exporter TauE/SafE family protein, partial [Pseudorhodoplanes sp.]
MDLTYWLLLLGAGFFGGTLGSIVGGQSLLTFPAMLAVGLPPIVANATNQLAIVPGNFIAAAADLEKFPPLNAAFYRIAAFSVAGALFGTLLLLYTPSTVFEKLVPILLALATALFAYGKSINNWIRARALSL